MLCIISFERLDFANFTEIYAAQYFEFIMKPMQINVIDRSLANGEENVIFKLELLKVIVLKSPDLFSEC